MVTFLVVIIILMAAVIFADGVTKFIAYRERQHSEGEQSAATAAPERPESSASEPAPMKGVTVEAEVAEETEKENQMKRDIYSFTIDIKTFVRNAMNDPSVLADIKAAIKEGPLPPTEMLGACNLKDADSDTDNWYTVFPATVRGVEAGQSGYLARNNSGTRISFRLRRQERKNHTASSDPQATQSQEVGVTAQLLAAALAGDQEAARAILALANDVASSVKQETPPAAAETQAPPQEDNGLDEMEDLFGAAAPAPSPELAEQEAPQEALAAAEEPATETPTDAEEDISEETDEDASLPF